MEGDDGSEYPEFNSCRQLATRFGDSVEAHRLENQEADLMLIMKDLQSFVVRIKRCLEHQGLTGL